MGLTIVIAEIFRAVGFDHRDAPIKPRLHMTTFASSGRFRPLSREVSKLAVGLSWVSRSHRCVRFQHIIVR